MQRDFRLWNDYGARAAIDASLQFAEPTEVIFEHQNVGPTAITVSGTITLQIDGGGQQPPPIVIQAFTFHCDLNTEEPGQHGLQTGGAAGDTSVKKRAAGRIGPLLEPFEQALIPKRAAPFTSEVTISTAAGGKLVPTGEGSQIGTPIVWPTFHVYEFNPDVNRFERDDNQSTAQAPHPFDWIDQFGTPW